MHLLSISAIYVPPFPPPSPDATFRLRGRPQTNEYSDRSIHAFKGDGIFGIFRLNLLRVGECLPSAHPLSLYLTPSIDLRRPLHPLPPARYCNLYSPILPLSPLLFWWCPPCPPLSTHRVAIATFWRVFHPRWKNLLRLVRVGCARPPLFTLSSIMYIVVVYAPAVHSLYFYSTPISMYSVVPHRPSGIFLTKMV